LPHRPLRRHGWRILVLWPALAWARHAAAATAATARSGGIVGLGIGASVGNAA